MKKKTEIQELTFEQKLTQSHNIIQDALQYLHRPVVSCSFGKDSMATLHLVQQYIPDIQVFWCNTGVEYPENYAYAKKIIQEWNLKTRLVETKPQTTFWKVFKKYGFPIWPRSTKGKAQIPTVQCCRALRKHPAHKAGREYKWDVGFDGITKWESRNRFMFAKKYGHTHFHKEDKILKVRPILDWTEEDVWRYHEQEGIPHNLFYDQKIDGYTTRTGCWPCTQGLSFGKMKFVRTYYPKLFNILIYNKGLGRVLFQLQAESWKDVKSRQTDKAFLLEALALSEKDFNSNLKVILAEQPCFFDKLNLKVPKPCSGLA